jgi:8-amino-7-oxononanoate synthase
VDDLEKKCKLATGKIFIITEALFSMEGDLAPLSEINEIVKKYSAHLIIDEAHSTGTLGNTGNGLWNSINLKDEIFARIYTFGKALGANGAIICTNQIAYNYIMNYAHPAIYSTAPMPLQACICRHQLHRLKSGPNEINRLQNLIHYWNQKNTRNNSNISNNPNSPIQYIKAAGNENALNLAKNLQTLHYQIKPMLSPTVSPGQERLRITLHAFNTEAEISALLDEFQNI